ncbi:MAG: hypothetical protein AAGJ83_00740, partial [Planctomycetota bacterium]
MNRILTVAQRELMAMIGTKAFLITLIMMPMLMGGGIILMPMLSKMEGGKERTFAVLDGTNKLGPVLVAAAEQRNAAIEKKNADVESGEFGRGELDTYTIELIEGETEGEVFGDKQRLQYSKKVTDGDLYAFVEIPSTLIRSGDADQDVEAATDIRFVSTSGALSEARGWFRQVLRGHLRNQYLQQAGIDPAAVLAAEPAFSIVNSRPYKADADG